MNELLKVLQRLWPYLIVLGPGLWALYLRWTDRAAGRVTERHDLIKIAQEAAGEVIDELRQETARLRTRLGSVEQELASLQKLHTQMIADKDAKITLLEGEKRQLEMKIAAYEDLLVRHHIPLPKQSQAYWITTDDGLVPAENSPPAKPKR